MGTSSSWSRATSPAAAEEKAIRALLGWRPKGLIIQAFVQSKSARESIAAAGVPMVEISEIKGRTPMNLAVGISNFDAAYAMTKHLAEKGYKRIGFVARPFTGTTASVRGGSGTGRPWPTWVSTKATSR